MEAGSTRFRELAPLDRCIVKVGQASGWRSRRAGNRLRALGGCPFLSQEPVAFGRC